MSSLITNVFRNNIASSILNDIQYGKTKYFHFIGKIAPWASGDTVPTSIVDTQSSLLDVRNEMVIAKRVEVADVSLVIDRINWTSGTTYAMWDDSVDMSVRNFYVVTSEFKVYKCLDNNTHVDSITGNPISTPSTVMPTDTTTKPQVTSDGYMWKYMYTVADIKKTKFLSLSHLPIQRAVSDRFYNNGSVSSATLIAGGSGYTNSTAFSLVASTTGSGANTIPWTLTSKVSTVTGNGVGTIGTTLVGISVTGASNTIYPYSSTSGSTIPLHTQGTKAIVGSVGTGQPAEPASYGLLGFVTVGSGGSGYTKGCTITINSATGSGFLAHVPCGAASGPNGAIRLSDIVVDSVGANYTTGDTLVFSVGNAVIVPSLTSSGSFDKVTVVSPGLGYVDAPSISFTGTTTPGTGKYAGNTTAIFTAFALNGQLQRISVVDPGIGYPLSASTTISVSGDGTGASFTPVVYNNSIFDIIMESAGSNYTYCNLTINGTGTGAKATANLIGSDFQSDQSIIEQTAIDGAIYAVQITNNGVGYTHATVAISGDGTGATATVSIVNNKVSKINMVSFGSGYTYATATISGDGSGALAQPVMSPSGGHGKDAPIELYAKTLAVYSNLRGALSSDILQDFRQYGLISGIKDYYTGADIVGTAVVKAYITAAFNSTTGMVLDEILTVNSAQFRVLSINGNLVNLVPLSNPNISPTGSGITGSISSPTYTYTCSSITSTPNYNKYSGQIVYFSDDPAFSYSDVQSILIKTYIRF